MSLLKILNQQPLKGKSKTDKSVVESEVLKITVTLLIEAAPYLTLNGVWPTVKYRYKTSGSNMKKKEERKIVKSSVLHVTNLIGGSSELE